VTDRSNWTVKKYEHGEEPPDDLSSLTPAERIAMVWEITKNASAFKEPGFRESRLRRDVVRVVRRAG
jgi:hypothetical protein